ncbi:putative ribonuclease H-like domain-containing protein [Tanacetum coccineum]
MLPFCCVVMIFGGVTPEKNSRDIILVQVYVDDIIFGSTNQTWCDEFEVLMKGKFEMSAMGELTFFLGLQVKQQPDGIFISQDKYVQDMLRRFAMESVRPATTPYEADSRYGACRYQMLEFHGVSLRSRGDNW